MLSIIEVRTRRALKAFIKFPLTLYKDCKQYVPSLRLDELYTLRKDKNPAMDFCEAKYWLAYREGKIVGRIAGIINNAANDLWHQKSGRFGYIDFIDDIQVARALIDTVETWLLEKGMTKIQGPLCFTDFDLEGMLIKGYEHFGTMTTIYNYPYYVEHIQALGYIKEVDWLEYEIILPDTMPEAVNLVADRALQSNNLRVLQASKKKDIMRYVPKLFELINTAFKELYEFTPMTDRQIALYTKQYKTYLDPDFVKFVLNENDDVVAYVLGFPSLSRALKKCKGRLFPFGFIYLLRALKHNNRLEIVQIAIDPKYQRLGVNAILFKELIATCKRRGIVCADLNPQLEDNKKVRSQWSRFKHRQHKVRTCFYKDLT